MDGTLSNIPMDDGGRIRDGAGRGGDGGMTILE